MINRSIPNQFSRRSVIAGLGAAIAAPVMGSAETPVAYPTKNVTIVVPFAAGGMSDIVARSLSQFLQQTLGHPFIVMTRPGAGGGLGIQAVANAPNDGYTLLLTLSSISTLPVIAKVEGKPPLFERRQFVPIARLAADPALIYVRREAPWQTIDDLVADARKNPGKFSYTSSGRFGPTHIPMEMFLQATGTDMLHIPTTGGGPSMALLLGGHADIFFTIPGLGMEQVEAGSLRVLAVSTRERLARLPHVPTLIERGIDVEYTVWAGLFVRSDVPGSITKQLAQTVETVATDLNYVTSIKKTGIEPAYLEPVAFRQWWDEDASRVEAVIRKAEAAHRAESGRH